MTAEASETIAEMLPSALPKKVAERSSGGARASFSPEMLEDFCMRVGEALSERFAVKTVVTLDSIGVERFDNLLEALAEPASVGIIELNSTPSAALMSFDSSIVFHAVDLMLGADPEADEAPLQRPPSALDDQLCLDLANTVVTAFGDACDQKIGPGACTGGSVERIEHRKVQMEISPPLADALSVKMAVQIGLSGRSGTIDFYLPLTTVDLICGGNSKSTKQPFSANSPWFAHMQSSVLEMELDLVAVLHKENMNVAELSRFDIGKVIPLPRDVVADVQLLLEDGDDPISSGELGASSGRRGVRLSDAPNEAFFGPLRNLINTLSSAL